MSYSSVEAHAKEYFWSLSPLAKRVASDVTAARDAYEDLWITLSLSDQRQVVDDAIIRPDAALKYSFCPRGRAPVEYFPRLRLQTGGKIVSEEDGKISWRDEHSAPFSFMTRSQLNLSLTGAEPATRSSPRKPAEGFLDPPSVVLGGSSTHDSPPPAGFLTRLRNKSAVLKIQALGRPGDRQPLISPPSCKAPEIVAGADAKAKAGSGKGPAPKPSEPKAAAAKPVAPMAETKATPAKPGDSKASSAKPGDSKASSAKPGDSKATSAKLIAPIPDPKAASSKAVATVADPKPAGKNTVDSKAPSTKPVAPVPDPKSATAKPVVSQPSELKPAEPKLTPGKAPRCTAGAVSPKRKPRTPPPPPPGVRDPERVRLLPPSPDEPPPSPPSPPGADMEGARLAALQANLSLESLQEFHSALNSPTGSCSSLPKTGFDFLDNW